MIGRLLACLLLAVPAFAQKSIEFIENKGQWNAAIRYRGDLRDGAFLLQNDGYRVVRYQQDDLKAIGAVMHGMASVSNPAVTTDAKTSLPTVPSEPGGGNTGGDRSLQLRGHIYEVRFLNANPHPEILPDKPLPGVSNYLIGNDSSKWGSGCRSFSGITYRNVYPNIDVRYYTASGVLKYDFIVHPGGHVSDINMYVDGADNVRLKEGNLLVTTSVDEVKEMAPYSYQLVDGVRSELPSAFTLKGSTVSFSISQQYNPNATLVIDPSVVFSTFTGSTSDNWGYTATYDNTGNFYAGGIVFGPSSGFPTNNGAFQVSYQGGGFTGESFGFDMGIIKFDPSGSNRLYATYLGGSKGNEQPHSLIVDGDGNLVIAGRTTSSDYPLKGSLQTYGPVGNGWNIVITKLNPSGSAVVASVKIGGSKDNGVNIRHKYPTTGAISIVRNYGDDARSEVILDASGNVYLATCTQSPDFPVTAISGQTGLGGTNASGRAQDAVFLKLNSDLSAVLFSIIIGGGDDDAAFVLTINPVNNHIYMAGATASSNFPGNKTGVKYGSFQGGISDGFVCEYTLDGQLIRDSYFGTSGIDVIYGIQSDKYGYVYITGTTTGTWPVVNAAYNSPGGKQFICKLQPDLSDFVYSTTFGPANVLSPNISPTAFLVDRCENVYVAGWGGNANTAENYPSSGTQNLPVTSDAYQKQTSGSDFYFFVLEKNATSQLYGSFFGQLGTPDYGEHVDGGTSRFDKNGVIYMAVCSDGTRFPTTPGSWSPQLGNSRVFNEGAIKIAFNLAGIAAGIQSSINGIPRDTSGCSPLTVNFSDTLAMGKQYIWDFNDGSPEVTTTTPGTSHTFNTIGFYRVRLVSVDSSSCNITDTAYLNLRVRDDAAALSMTAVKLPPCSSLAYQFDNTSVATKSFSSNSFRWDFGDGTSQLAGTGVVTHTYAATGSYVVKLVLLDTSFCNGPDSISQPIRIAANVKAQFVTPAAGCAPYTASFQNTSQGGIDFNWDFGDGASSTQTNPTHLYVNPGSYQVRLVVSDTSSCNKVDTSAYFTITVASNPSSQFSYTPQPTQPNTAVSFLNNSAGASNYKWIFGDGDSLLTTRPDTTISHLYNITGTYNTCLVAYNSAGCTDTSCQQISVTVNDLASVPTAFTPNGDGTNDRIYVRGYGITKMTWTIYNRWGSVVYIGTDPNEGWDGRYKGLLQPEDVYHYTLIVEFGNKSKSTMKGDITLLR